MSRRMSPRRPAAEADAELNLIPILNLVLMLIPAILITAVFVQIAVINVAAPLLDGSIGQPSPAEPPSRQLRLTIALTDQGIHIAGSGGLLVGPTAASGARGPTIPRTASGEQDWAALQRTLIAIKDAFPEETRCIITAEPEIPYAQLVEAMDAARETADRRLLFPDVVLSPELG